VVLSLSRYIEAKNNVIDARGEKKKAQSGAHSRARQQSVLEPVLSKGSQAWFELARYLMEVLGVVFSPVRLVYELFHAACAWVPSVSGIDEIYSSVIRLSRMSGMVNPVKAWASRSGFNTLAYAFWDAGPTLYYYLFRSKEYKPLSPHGSPQLQMLKEVRSNLNSLKAEIQRAKKDNTKHMSVDLGKSVGFAVLVDECFDKLISGYKWELCMFKSARQGATSVGKWYKWSPDRPNTMLYTSGQKCYNGPSRSLKVHLTCHLTEEILSVEEPSTCEYEMEFGTPLVCDRPAE